MKDVFTTNDKLFASRPHSSQAMIVGYNYSSFGFAPYGTYWRNMRKLATIELLSNHRTRILNYVQISEVSTLVKELYLHCKTNKNAKINMSERIEHLILNIITRMVAGKRYFDGNKEARDDAGRPIGEIIREFMFVTGALVPGDLIPFLGWLDINGVVKTMTRVTKEVDVIVDSWIEEHKNKSDNDAKKDFLDVMLSVVEDDASMGLDRETIIKGTTTAIILAGSDTSAITTLWALSSLVNNRHALKRAQEEIDQKVGRDRCVQVSDIDKLEYLTAVIKETLRLYPPGPLGVPREAAEDCFVSGYFIPKGTRLFTHLWKLHRDPNIWSDPEAFIPERFLTTNANLDVTGQNFEYIPFSAGRRSCPGLNLAMQMLHLALARLIQAYDMKTPTNEPVDMTEAQGIVMPRKTPLEILVVPRLAPEFYEQ